MGRDAPSSRQILRSADIRALVAEVCPDARSVLEVGPEHGWTGEAIKTELPGATIDAVEIWEPYVDLCRTREWYDTVTHGDAFDVLDGCEDRYDVAVACDVLEHVEQERGERFLELLSGVARVAIIATPVGFMPQGAYEGNPYQTHLSGWHQRDVEALGWTAWAMKPPSYGVYFKTEAES